MKPFQLTVAKNLDLTIIPDSDAHMDGHPVLTYSYSIYKNDKEFSGDEINKMESALHLETNEDPNYMGVILFEEPGRLFTYRAGHHELASDEVEELIEQITHYRESPARWII